MSAIEKDRLLRINCPGFGVDSYFSMGCAKALQEYDVIVVNPISALHLFDKDPDLLKQIEAAQQDGMTSYLAKSDKLLQSVYQDLEGRRDEIAMFLGNGGLLVYFLCPPFLVQGPSEILSNYCWLDILAPDNSQDKANRHMSSASRGKNIEPSPEAQAGPFGAYFKQPGVEWTTIIRTEKLTEGYSVLATAGPNKCIAAHYSIGDKGGRVVFLPAPYQAEFDRVLVECINEWARDKSKGAPAAKAAAPQAAPTPAPAPAPAPAPTAPSEPPVAKAEPAPTPLPEPAKAEEKRPEPAPEPVAPKPEAKAEPPKAESPPKEQKPKQEEKPKSEAKPEPASGNNQAPKAKDLMDKMEEIAKPSFPEWCLEYSFSDLDQLREQLLELNEQVRLTQMKISEVEGRIDTMEWLKNSLLSSEGDDLLRACTKVFETLGWKVKNADNNKGELWLMEGDWTAAIARIVRTTSQVKRSDLASLAESIITYWGEHEQEPKGVLVASTWANRPPSERTESDYTDALAEFAEKKNLCLMTTSQLLCIFRDIEGGYMSADDLKQSILSTSGRLEGYVLEPGLAAAAS